MNMPMWAKFLALELRPEIEPMISAVAGFMEAWRDNHPPRWLTLCGDSGTGKTHCARKVWNWIRKTEQFRRGMVATQWQPAFLLWPEAIARLRCGDAWDWFRDIQRWPFVVIDDFGAERDPTGFAADQLYMLMSMRDGRWTMFTSNLTARQIAAIDARIISRLIRNGSDVVEVKAKDFNL